MIRKFENSDTAEVMQLWLNGNLDAHPFIEKEYWQANFQEVEKQLLDAEVFVYEQDGQIKGFIGLMGNYIAGIFVDRNSRSTGIGQKLLDYVKDRHEALLLEVYQKNQRAIDFYRRQGFIISSEQVDEEADEIDLTMTWSRKKQ
ncbi:acetyltransferase [Lactobacillus pasteurii DSM 23907 = CRBIP 24.76]|uniref:Acetyltransferase n=1 Tax=Lactobacillus pasteurii DSM 23907 = CRBIP 24.76 TaxID=1423790 RepID=I7IYL2_9LACO|nr:N-acetyltransferase [Lactobacillus pasteurii]KRK07381.1 acetyltransferase [Lactobacillus pasteurii DSM 23907 = CRBIP 24.76]TDG77791.1 hypothetical protein C5L33_000015 [Lactobacillus pasteurii]CCI84567.1 Acetyltransferase [Lactobacillus pasteurii DSM 23907 = CRBIP 24.76]